MRISIENLIQQHQQTKNILEITYAKIYQQLQRKGKTTNSMSCQLSLISQSLTLQHLSTLRSAGIEGLRCIRMSILLTKKEIKMYEEMQEVIQEET